MKTRSLVTRVIVIFVTLLFVVANACHEDMYSSFAAENDAIAIEHAKAWYEAHKPAEIYLRSSDGKEKIQIKPAWNSVYKMKTGKDEVVETDIMTYGMMAFVNPDCMAKFNETNDRKYIQSYSRFVFHIDRKTNDTVGFLMTQVPNLEWLEKSKFKPFKKTDYLERDKDFGGWILFHNLDGSFSNGWVYENGKITGTINHLDPIDINFRLDPGDCIVTDWYYEVWNCPYWYTGSPSGYSAYCTLESKTYFNTTVYCQGGGDGSFGGGGSSNPNTPPTTPPEEEESPKVTLSGSGQITLMDPYNLSVSITPANFNCNSVEFKIYKGTGTKYILQNKTSTSCNEKARTPGKWTVKAIVNGSYESNEFSVDVQFPDVSDVESAESSKMSITWSATKNSASASGRSERGFWIFANTTSGTLSYECGATILGPSISGCEDTFGRVSPGSVPDPPYNEPLKGGKFPVAFFHTHTPLTFCPSSAARLVGPSDEDKFALGAAQIPGLVYDYAGIDGWLHGGHDINAAAQIYYCGPSRRTGPLMLF